jgi:hypothetical protein
MQARIAGRRGLCRPADPRAGWRKGSAVHRIRIRDNYIFDIGERIGLYVDEGSKHIRLEHNVIETQGFWLFANTVGKLYALRITSDNRAAGNWHSSDKVGQRWIPASDNLILEDHLVADKAWPAAAQQVIDGAGIQH